jgi:hypothetical protein
MQSWIRDLIDLKTQISVLQNCMNPGGSYRARSTAHSARSITVISMGSVLLPADRSSKPTRACGLDRALC